MARKKTPRMTRFEAESLLGLTGSYSYKDFQKAYRAAVKKNHPDMGGDAATMVKVNQAKDTIDYYFGDDKTQVFTASTDQEESAQEQQREEAAYQQERQKEATRQTYRNKREEQKARWEETIKFAYDRGFKFGFNDSLDPYLMTDKQRDYWMGMITSSWATYQSMFATTRMGFDLRGKPQSEWSDADWASFKSFKVPDIEYGNNDTPGTFAYWFFNTQVDDLGFGFVPRIDYTRDAYVSEWEYPTGVWKLDNIDTSSWTDDDWFYYWFANYATEPIIVDGVQYAHVKSLRTHHLRGPYAQREHAQAEPNYMERRKAYEDRWEKSTYHRQDTNTIEDCYRTTTYYGSTRTHDDYSWAVTSSVGIPFAYSDANLHTWQQFNREYLAGVPADDDWAGLEFLMEEDLDAPWISDLGLQEEVQEVAARIKQQKQEKEERERKEHAEGLAETGWIATHRKLTGWLLVALAYLALPTLTAPLVGVMGSVEAALFPCAVIQLGGLLATFIFRNKIVNWILKVQRQVFGKA